MTQNNFGFTCAAIAIIGGIVIFSVAASIWINTAFDRAIAEADHQVDLNMQQCRNSGGHVIEYHGGGIAFRGPSWACER